jgi:hypothetical protein
MKFAASFITTLLVADKALAFVPKSLPKASYNTRASSSRLHMAVDMPPAPQPASDLPVVQQTAYGQPADVRYSDFLKLVNSDRVEKVTFSADGTQLLGVDVDGVRLKIEALPNDPDLLTQLTSHKVSLKQKYSCRVYFTCLLLPCDSKIFMIWLTHCLSLSLNDRSMLRYFRHKKPAALASSPKA